MNSEGTNIEKIWVKTVKIDAGENHLLGRKRVWELVIGVDMGMDMGWMLQPDEGTLG